MLDDGEWHDVIFQRNRMQAKLVVDRLESEFETNGLFFRLDLDKKVKHVKVQFLGKISC